MTTTPSLGMHGTFAWSCAVECADVLECGDVFIAGTDTADGTHAFGTGCIGDRLINPEMYEDDGVGLHGTHRLTTEQLDEIFGAGQRHMPPDDVDLDEFIEWRPEDDDSILVAVAISERDNLPQLITLDVLTDMYRRPEWYGSDLWNLYGTHILTEDQIQHFFPGE